MNYPKVIMDIANAVGIKPHRGKYRMWHNVIYIGETAMVFDEVVMGGGYAITPYEESAFIHVPRSYIIDAVQHRAFSLGEYGSRSGGMTPWYKRVGKYPPGFFTHQVGAGVSGL